jgi:glycosyltransferase involved in cell wall biosynthesis
MSSAIPEKHRILSKKIGSIAVRKNSLPKNLLCFSHLRWDFVYQRPQHLMARFASASAVYFFEEPIFTDTGESFLVVSKRTDNVWICVPHLSHGLDQSQVNAEQAALLEFFFAGRDMSDFTFWYYTPMALSFTEHLAAGLTVYDCMDELSAFKFAPDEIKVMEKKLFEIADIVFTGGHSLYEAKKNLHDNIFPFPSSIDKKHFTTSRDSQAEPADQATIHGRKIGFYGVIDERFDIGLIENIATMRPDWNIMLIGPVVKIDAATLPQKPNIFYLGAKSYQDLPQYLSGWDVAIIPFLIDESTRFISPTKTPEYLCAGRPVVSTPITDIVNPYGANQLVSIASNASEFIDAIEFWMQCENKKEWLNRADKFLMTMSWDITFSDMTTRMEQTLTKRNPTARFEQDKFFINQPGSGAL